MNAFLGFAGRNDVTAYLVMMAIRLLEMKRVLKNTGSIFLHCDPGVSHYLKILMDAVFGRENFRNEIIWHYKTGGIGRRWLGRKHDTIFFYSKTKTYKFIPQKERSYLKHRYGFSNTEIKKGECPFVHDGKAPPALYTEVGLRDVWDIPALRGNQPEKMSYPTQKPLELLRRILSISTEEGDTVLDPFCGCGTAIEAAESMSRQWIGIDITYLAINLIEWRLKSFLGLEPEKDYRVIGKPVDLAGFRTLAKHNRFQFQWCVLALVNAKPYRGKKKGADTGIDGIIYFLESPDIKRGTKRAIVSVKSGSVGVKDVRDLAHVIERESCPVGILITLEKPTKPMTKEAASCGFYHSEAWGRDYPRLQILTVEEILNGVRPDLPHVLDYRGL